MPASPRSSLLSVRERQVLLLCAEGQTDVEIANELNISPKTVNFHVEKLKRLFSARNRVQLVAMALRRGIID